MQIETYDGYAQRLVPFDKIKRKDKTNYTYIKSGYENIDQLIGGFILGQVSVWSGLNGSGKSAFLNQQILEYISQGHKVMLFSAELMDYSIKNILYRLIAGEKYLTKSENGTYYYLADNNIKKVIDDYIGNNLYVYDNKFDKKPKEIINTITYAKEKLGVDIIILDNLMTMNLKEYSQNKYEAQSEFAKEIANVAKQLQVHIHIVMHPTKTTGFLRKNDISGSADLSNAVDNVFIIHRNNSDFKKSYIEFRNNKIREDNEIFDYDTYIEICKNREEGVQDRLLCFYFLPISKQIVENQKEKPYIEDIKRYYYGKQNKQ
jgi:predicted ATP-dependent serine protease